MGAWLCADAGIEWVANGGGGGGGGGGGWGGVGWGGFVVGSDMFSEGVRISGEERLLWVGGPCRDGGARENYMGQQPGVGGVVSM
jgi:hypothetical protein